MKSTRKQVVGDGGAADSLDKALCREIIRMRKDILEINELLSRPKLTASNLRRLKELFLQDASDAIQDLSSAEWQEILRTRVVVLPQEKKLSTLANMLCMA